MTKVLTCDDERVKFRWWCWWSDWIDVATYSHGYNGYLLQMSISRTNVKKFRSSKLSRFSGGTINSLTAGDLVDINTK